MQNKPDDELLTPKQAADLIKVSRATLYRWILRGKLPARTLGGVRYLLERKDVLAMLKRVEAKPRPKFEPPDFKIKKRSKARIQRTREILEQAGLM